MNVYKAAISRRTIRKFKQKEIPISTLMKLVNSARMAPSTANLQPLEYIIVKEKPLRAKIFDCVSWAGYIAPEGNPGSGEKPVAYIVIIVDSGVVGLSKFERDIGSSAENIMLSAWEMGMGSCWMGAINREKIAKVLKIPASYHVDTVIALGYKNEKPRAVPLKKDCKYWKGRDGELRVPKKSLKRIVHKDKF